MERKKRGPKGLGLSASAMKRRKKAQDKERGKTIRKVQMTIANYDRWMSLARDRGLTGPQLVVALLDAVDHGHLFASKSKSDTPAESYQEGGKESMSASDAQLSCRPGTLGVATPITDSAAEIRLPPREAQLFSTPLYSPRLVDKEPAYSSSDIDARSAISGIEQLGERIVAKESMNMKVTKKEREVEPQSEEHGYQKSTLIFREEDGEQTVRDVGKYIHVEPRPERNIQTFCLEEPDLGHVLTEYSRHEKPNVQTSEGVHRGDIAKCIAGEPRPEQNFQNSCSQGPDLGDLLPECSRHDKPNAQTAEGLHRGDNGESLQGDSKDALKDGDMIEMQSAEGDYQIYTCIIKEEPSDDGHICDDVPAPCSLRQAGGNAFKMKNVSQSEPTSREKSEDRLPAGENLSREHRSGQESSLFESERSMDGCELSQKSIQVDSSPGFAADEREMVSSASCHDKGTGSIDEEKDVSSNDSTSIELQMSKHVTIGSQLYKRAGTLPGFSCSHCDQVFSADIYLQKHIIQYHSRKGPFECTICGKVYHNKSTLSVHSRIHTCEYRCTICGECYCTRIQLSKHTRSIHPDKKPYECTICGKCYSQSTSLSAHSSRIHYEKDSYLCVVCGKRFSSKGEVSSHERIHTEEKPYQCTICNKKIAYKSSLLRHLGIHRRKGHYES